MSETIPTEVSYKAWVKRGPMMLLAEALEPNDPDHPYNQIAAKGLRPEDFGMSDPRDAGFDPMTREDLIEEIKSLRSIRAVL